MAHSDWNANYASGDLPWDTGVPDERLVELVRTRVIPPGRTLEIGCGTGTNALWLAERGFVVTAVDLAGLAIERARAKAAGRPGCRFVELDFLAGTPEGGPFDFVFDRGCFHVFDAGAERERFAARVAGLLAPAGQWLSLIGSTEGPPRDSGPPRRSARDIVSAVEPVLELVELRGSSLDTPAMWVCRTRRRDVPAQPSTVRAD